MRRSAHSRRLPARLLASLAGVAFAAAAPAATDEEELAQVFGDRSSTSLATGSRLPLRRAPAVATVITAEDIAAMGATDLDQVLESVPGLHVSRSNQAHAGLYLIRGIASEFNPQTLVLQDGVPMTTLFVGNRGNLAGALPLHNIARIEVIRGPGSALYGADAFSGVINLVTRSAEDAAGIAGGLLLGSFRSREGWLQAGGLLGPVAVVASLRHGRTDGARRTVEADAQTGLDAVFGTRASLAPGATNLQQETTDVALGAQWQGWQLHATYRLRDGVGTGEGVGSALDPVGRARTERFVLDLQREGLALPGGWRLGLAASAMRYTQTFPVALQIFPPGAFGGAFPEGMVGAPETWEWQLRLGLVASRTLGAHQLRVGLGHDDLDLYRTRELKNFGVLQSGPLIGLPVPTGRPPEVVPVADSFLVPQRRRVAYAYLQDEWSLAPDWTLTAGLRHDRYSDVGGTTNPRLALVWDASLDVTAKLLYGRAFRAPSFTELYSINNPVIRGNPALKPETIATLEAVLAWQLRPEALLTVSAFRHDTRNLIRTASSGDGSARFDNLGHQRGRGADLELEGRPLRALRVAAHLAWQRTTDLDTGTDAGHAPHRHGWLRADWQGRGWQASGRINRVADRRRAAGDARPPVPDFTTVDLTLRWAAPGPGWTLAATVLNLFDADVREPSLAPGTALPYDLPMPGRSLLLQLEHRF